MQIILGLSAWFAICASISFFLEGGSSEAAMPLTELLFCGVSIDLIGYNWKAHNGKYNKKQEGDFTMKQIPSAIKSIYEQADITIKPSVVEHTRSANQIRLQEKLKLYHSLWQLFCRHLQNFTKNHPPQ